jgi:hypothetical protein
MNDNPIPDLPPPDVSNRHGELKPLPQIPRLSIRHVMIWTASCAVCLAIRNIWMPDGRMVNAWMNIPLVAYALFAGTSLLGVALWIECRVRRIPFLVAPGNWLLLINGFSTLAKWSTRLVCNSVGLGMFDSGLERWLQFLPNVGEFVMFVFAYVVHAKQRGWNSVFALGCAYTGCTVLSRLTPFVVLLAALSLFFYLLLAIRLLIAAVGELRRNTKRDWIHWLGVVVELASCPVSIAFLVFSVWSSLQM